MLDPNYLRERLSYDPHTGLLTWNAHASMPPKWNARFAGKPAFTAASHGYKVGRLDGVKHYAHRIVFAILHAAWPEQIDHINRDKSDNRACNLRMVSPSENCRNLPKSQRNTSGVTGVHWDGNRSLWVARIRVNRRSLFLGRFSSITAAQKARKKAEIEHGFSLTHGV